MTRCIGTIHIQNNSTNNSSVSKNWNCLEIENTHIDDESRLSEDHSLRSVGRNVSVELLAIPVPLDGVERVALQVVVALQHHVLASDGVGGDGLFSQSDRV